MAFNLSNSNGLDVKVPAELEMEDLNPLIFTRRLVFEASNEEDQESIIVLTKPNDPALESAAREVALGKTSICIFGSTEHKAALERKIKEHENFLQHNEEEWRLFEEVKMEKSNLKRQIEYLENEKGQNVSENPEIEFVFDDDFDKTLQSPTKRLNSMQELRNTTAPSFQMLVPKTTADNATDDHTTNHEFGVRKNIKVIEHHLERPIFNLPRLRQYFIGNIFFREKDHRKVSWDELFFDLLFVVNFANVGSQIDENRTFGGLFQYFLLFYPIWMVWFTTTIFLNRVLLDDLSSKLYLLYNAGSALFMTLTSKGIFSLKTKSDPVISANVFTAAFLASRVMFFILSLMTLLKNPKFKLDVISETIYLLLSSVIYLISILASTKDTKIYFWTAAVIVDIVSIIMSPISSRYIFKTKYRMGTNIEHFTERVGLLTIIVIGEMILLLKPKDVSDLARAKFAASFLGLMNAACLQWIYFNIDSNKQFVHAQRRGTSYGLLWRIFHIPLHTSILIGAAGLDQQIESLATAAMKEEVKLGLFDRLMYPFSLFGSLISLVLIASMHYSPRSGLGIFSKNIRLITRSLTAIFTLSLNVAFALLDWPILPSLGVTSSLIFAQAIFEEIAKENLKAKAHLT